MLLKRWITAVVALPLLIFWILKGGAAAFCVLALLVCLLSLFEYLQLADKSTAPMLRDPFALLTYTAGALLIGAAFLNASEGMPAIVGLHLLAAGSISLFGFKGDPAVWQRVARHQFGLIYVALFLSFLVLLRGRPMGEKWLLAYLLIIFAGDTAAFYVGTLWGRRKLAPDISPGKTVAGAFGGLGANAVVAVLLNCFWLHADGPLVLVFALAVGAIGQAGDLFESLIKRDAHIKDSGRILPGHGGMLDRIDAVLFAAPAAYYLLRGLHLI